MGYFIPHESLPHLKEYKYQSEDRSLLTKYVLKKFWVQFEKIFPLNMAPNMVTLCGLLFILTSLITVFYMDPDFNKESPSWYYILHAFSMLMYQTFDACDGIHARRTQQSGPLGELFDHCIDAINTTLSIFIFASVAGLGKTWLIVFAQFASLMNFYLSTWEEFYTHKLFLSEFSGPVEGICMLMGLYLLTAIYGNGLWKFNLLKLDFNIDFLNLKVERLITSTDFSIVFGSVVLYFNITSAMNNVNKYLKANPQEHATENPFNGLIPFFTYYLSVFTLLFFNQSIIGIYTIPIMLTIGSTIAFIVGRIITNHLTKQRFPYFNFPCLIPIVQIFLITTLQKVFGMAYEDVIQVVVYLGLGLGIGIHGMFIFEIIYDITTYLDIYALTIKHKKVV